MKYNPNSIVYSVFALVVIGIGLYFYLKPRVYIPSDDCFVKTGLSTTLLSAPDIFAPQITTLPRYKTYDVLEVHIVQHVGDKYLFLIEDQELNIKGWVEPFPLDFVHPSCYEN